MLFRQLFDATSCTYTYVIASNFGREALIIDPVKDQLELYQQLLAQWQLKLVYALDTHTHADHVTASGSLRQAHACQIVGGDHCQAECIDLTLKEGERLNLDGIELVTMYTPGHTSDSYSYHLDDRVFTGDTLLIRGTGRTDFQSGSAEQQYDSLFNKLLKLPETTLVYPAHDYKGMTASSIGEEKRYNPRLQVSSPEEYCDIMANLNLAYPKMIDIAVPANLKCGLNGDKHTEGKTLQG